MKAASARRQAQDAIDAQPAPLILSAGEPAGIGPDLAVLLAQTPPPCPLVICASRKLLTDRAALRGLIRRLQHQSLQVEQFFITRQ